MADKERDLSEMSNDEIAAELGKRAQRIAEALAMITVGVALTKAGQDTLKAETEAAAGIRASPNT